jgi:hypothetical protein
MKTKLLIVSLMVIGIVACKKDQYNTTPELKFKKVSTDVIAPGQSIIFSLEVTDKEGDIQDTIYVEKVRLNEKACATVDPVSRNQMPAFTPTKNFKGDIEVRYSYGINLQFPPIQDPKCAENDTCIYRFWIKDNAQNVSDTISSSQLVIIKG